MVEETFEFKIFILGKNALENGKRKLIKNCSFSSKTISIRVYFLVSLAQFSKGGFFLVFPVIPVFPAH